jgi:hypothetical protein
MKRKIILVSIILIALWIAFQYFFWFFNNSGRYFFQTKGFKIDYTNYIQNQRIPWEEVSISTQNKQVQEILKRDENIKYNKEGYLQTKETIDANLTQWELPAPVILESKEEINKQPVAVIIPQWTSLKDQNWSDFTGKIQSPEIIYKKESPAPQTPPENIIPQEIVINQEQTQEKQHAATTLKNQNIIKVIKVGNDEENIQLKDNQWNPQKAIIIVPMPESQVWDVLRISYSQDNKNRYYLTSTVITWTKDARYAIFETTHFTLFALWIYTWTFAINNDNAIATGTNITLNSSISGATHMRYGTSTILRDSAPWTGYQDTRSFTLNGIQDGIARVYAQFSGQDWQITNVSDYIVLDQFWHSLRQNLLAHIDGSENSTTFFDVWPVETNNFTKTNSPTTGTINWEQYMTFNGSNQSATLAAGLVTAYPFTISARVNPSRLEGTQSLVMRYRNGNTNTYFGIQLNADKAALIALTNETEGTTTLNTGQWYHIVWVFESATVRKLYVNTVQEATWTVSSSLSSVQPRFAIGSYQSTNYFSWSIDEVRIYSRALNQNEISWLFMRHPTLDDILITPYPSPTIYGFLPNQMYFNYFDLCWQQDVSAIGNSLWSIQESWCVPTGYSPGAEYTLNITAEYSNVYWYTGGSFERTGAIVKIPNITYSTWSETNFVSGNVIASLANYDPTYTISNNKWSTEYTFTWNGNFSFEILDQIGNSATASASVNRIDKINPIIAFTWSTPWDGYLSSGNRFTGQIDVIETNLSQFKRWRNGTTYTPYNSGLIMMFNFDNIAALWEYSYVVVDISQYWINGGLDWPTWTSDGKRWWAFSFDGTNAISLDFQSYLFDGSPNPNLMFDSNAITVEARIKTTSWWTIISKWDGNNYETLRLAVQPNALYIDSSNGSDSYWLFTANNINDGNWHHIVATIVAGTDFYAYMDGVALSDTMSMTPPSNIRYTHENMYIWYDNISNYFNWIIDELRMYNYSLNAWEIAHHMKSNLSKYDTDRWLYTTIYSWISDWTYRYTWSVIDKAKASESISREFTIDITPPNTTITSPANGNTFSENFDVIFSDTDNLWLSSCYTRILSGTTQTSWWTARECSSTININQSAYCPVNGTNNCIVVGYSVDNVGNVSSLTTWSYSISISADATPPTVPTLTSPITWYIATTTPNLTWWASTDAGVGVSGYNYQISTGNTFAVIFNQWTGTATNRSPGTLTNGTKYFRRVRSFDQLYNTSAYSNTGEFTVDTMQPSVSPGWISVGTTGNNGSTLYYRWAITVYAIVGDNFALSGATCAYTTGITRATATFNTTNCTASIGSPTATLNIRFRIADQAGNVTTGATGTYLYDPTPPSVPNLISPITWYIATRFPSFTRNGSTDSGVGVSGYHYQVSTSNTFGTIQSQWTGVNTNRSPGMFATGVKYFRRVRSFDKLYNTSTYSSTGEFTVDISWPNTTITSPIDGTTFSGNFDVSFSDTDNIWVSWCYMRILSGSTQTSWWTARTCNATTTINKSAYCSATWTNNCIIVGYAIDIAGNTWNYATWIFSIGASTGADTIPPVTTITSPSNWSIFSWNFTVRFNDSDSWGFWTCYVRILSGNTQTSWWTTRTCSTTSDVVINRASYCPVNGVNNCIVVGYAIDSAWNTWNYATWTFSIDTIAPAIGTAEIYSWSTGNNGATLYYKWMIDFRATATDSNWINTNTCEYTTGTTWASAARNWTHCVKTWLIYTTNLTLNFRARDIPGLLWTGTSATYNYDATPPVGGSFTINGWASATNSTSVTLNITCPTDSGVSGIQMAFGNTANPSSNRQACVSSTGYTITAGDGSKTVYMRFRDALGNTQASDTTDDITLDQTAPTSPTLTCTNFTHNTTWTYGGSITCSINDTASPSSRTAVAYSTNSWWAWTDNSNGLSFMFIPNQGITYIMMRISDQGWTTNSNTYIIRKSDSEYIILSWTSDVNTITNQLISWWYILNWSSINNTTTWYLVWTKSLNFEYNSWNILVPIIIQSTGGDSEVQFSSGIIIKTAWNARFTGIINPPISQDTSIWINDIVNVIRFGTPWQWLFLKDISNNPLEATLRIAAPWKNSGDKINILYSTDASTWRLHKLSATVISLNDQPYAEFTTNHFTDFAIQSTTWSFTINSDNAYTNNKTVTLNINIPVSISGMRFSNDGSSRSSRQTYTSSRSWILTWSDWNRIVYAQFDNDGDTTSDVETNDTIIVDTVSPQFAWVNTGWYYTWAVTITFSDDNISHAILSGINWNTYYNSNLENWSTIGNNWDYILIVYDLANNYTGATFTIENMSIQWSYWSYISWDWTNKITFEYIITAWDNTPDLDYSSTTWLILDGWTIKDASTNNNAILTLFQPWAFGSLWYNKDILIDTTIPRLTTGYISVGTTGINGNTGYYKWIITIRTSVYDSWYANISGNTCEYTTGLSRNSAIYSWIYSTWIATWYCEKTGLNMIGNIFIRFRIADQAGNVTTGATGTYLYDATASTVPTLTSPITWYIATTTPNLTWWASTDAGVGVSGYNYQISTGNTFAVILNQWTGIATNRSPGTLTNGTKYFRRVRSFDKLYNTSAYSSTGEFTVDTTSPVVSTGYISVGTTGNNGATLYYRWAITVYATVSDTRLSGATCAYTTGITRATATFNTTNCTASIGSPTATLNIRFRIADQAGNVTTGATGTYLYDATASTVPTLTSPITWYIATTTPNLTWWASTDAGVGVSGYNYQISTGNTFAVILNQWTGIATNRSPGTLTNGTKYFRRVRSFDKLYNTSAYSSTGEFTVDTTSPVVSTGYISVGTTGNNGATLYYRWAITVYATVSDTRLSGATCAYTTGITRATATFNTTNCTASIGSPTATLNIRFRIADQAGNVTTGATGTYLYDATASTVPTLTSPITWYIATTTPNLTRNGSTDAGVGVSGYNYQISTGNTFAVILNQWTGIATNRSPGTLTNGTKYFRRVRSFDKLYNTSAYSSTGEFTVDTTSPVVSTGYISVGITWQNGNTGYYKTVSVVYATVSDTLALSGATCAYTTGITRATATFNWSSCTGWVGGTPTATLNIRFRIADQAGNVTTGGTGIYVYNNTPPSIVFTWSTPAHNSTWTSNTFTPQIQIDENGVWMSQFIYSFNGQSYSVYDSGLILMYNFDNIGTLWENWTIVKDVSQYSNTGTSNWATHTWNGRYNWAYDFNWTSNKITTTENVSLWISWQISYWARFKADTLSNRNGIMSRMRERWTWYNLQVWTAQKIACGMWIYVNSNITPQTWVWYHAVCVYDWTKMKLYVNWEYQNEWTATLKIWPDPLTIWVFYTPSNLYFDWLIDNVFVYNRALSTGEIDLLYRSNLNKFTASSWLFTDERMCMVNWTYNYTGIVSDLLWNTNSTGRVNNLSIPAIGWVLPWGIDLLWVNTSYFTQVLSWQFTGYFQVSDSRGNTGWYTTIKLPLKLSGTNNPNLYIPQSNIYFKWDWGIVPPTWLIYVDSWVYMSGGSIDYVTFTWVREYIKRDVSSNPYICPTGNYGNRPWIKVVIWSWQPADIYTGFIEFDIIAN